MPAALRTIRAYASSLLLGLQAWRQSVWRKSSPNAPARVFHWPLIISDFRHAKSQVQVAIVRYSILGKGTRPVRFARTVAIVYPWPSGLVGKILVEHKKNKLKMESYQKRGTKKHPIPVDDFPVGLRWNRRSDQLPVAEGNRGHI